jgi:ribosomal protein L11 methyltransferase
MAYIEVNIETSPEYSEIFMAELAELSFEAFEEVDDGLLAYIKKEDFSQALLDELVSRYEQLTTFSVSQKEIEKKNWNKEWEKNYDPITIEDKCIVRASFHQPDKKYLHEIIITPKMSFGTGHHATTWQMLKLQMEIDHKRKKVLDVGSGTGILAIMANKLGAKLIEATDIDDWCIENSKENFQVNQINDYTLKKGVIEKLSFDQKFDIVLANINKNVLLAEIPLYVDLLEKKGTLLLSGYYEKDVEDIKKIATENNLRHQKTVSKDNWAAMLFAK